MLLAYIDEIGETGAFVGRDHPRYNTSPTFGYAGFIIPAVGARKFGEVFTVEKRRVFKTEIEEAAHAGRWERKGADIFRPKTFDEFPQQIRVFNALVNCLRDLDGALFYYADEKPLGTPGQTKLDTDERERAAMREALNRIARHAARKDSHVMVLMDQINEKQRAARLPLMYGHIFGRAGDYPEMKRIVEPPMHVDSRLSSNIQFSDWVAACVTRAIDYQLIKESLYQWVTKDNAIPAVRGAFTHESKVHLWHRSLGDINHSEIFRNERRLHPLPQGQLLGDGRLAQFRKIKAAAERAKERSTTATS